MGTTDFIITNIGIVTDNLESRQLKQTVVEQIGRFKILSKTKDFFEQHTIVGAESWTKQEKNCFSHALNENSHKNEIINLYNENIKKSGEMKNKVDFLKNLSSISQLMKAYPYNEAIFKSEVYQSLVDWGFDGNEENIRLLKKSFNLYIDKHMIEDFISSSSEKKHGAFTFIKAVETLNKSIEMNCTLSTSIAGLISIGAMGALNPIADMLNPLMPTVSEHFGSSPGVALVASLAVVSFTFYKTFQTLNKASKEIIESQRSKLITYTEPEKMLELSSVSLLNKRILGDIMWKENFNLSNDKNKKFLILSAFANEKLKHPNLKISPEMEQDLGLTANQIKNLNKINRDKVHSLSLISDPAIRTMLMLENTSRQETLLLKNLSLMKEISKVNNEDGLYFKDSSSINNISHSLKKKIDKMDEIERCIIVSFLQIQSSQSGNCPPGLMKNLEKNLDSGVKVINLVKDEIQLKYLNTDLKSPKNEELAYTKRLIKWVKMEEKIAVINEEIKNELKQIGDKYQFSQVEVVNKSNTTVIGKVKTVGDDILIKIQNIRNVIYPIVSNNPQP